MDVFFSNAFQEVIDYIKTLGINVYPFGDNYFHFGYEKDDTFGFICENKDNIVVRFIYVDLLSNKPNIDTFNWEERTKYYVEQEFPQITTNLKLEYHPEDQE